MFTSKEKKFIQSRDICRLATCSGNKPHCVPVGYVFSDGSFYIPTAKKTKKVKDIEKNPEVCIVIDDDKAAGIMIKGKAEITDAGKASPLRKSMENLGWTIGGFKNTFLIVIKPKKKVSWKLDI
ncbi:MAG: pyridoxamine 5'-phosphate oxidase family protein [Candidatus Aenigmarchaeota archaeon]|nr:pyridoxamine 5'-phosphate oxidase family protein [Candidatus Aenigmarchaeota archaeon]